MEITNKDFYKRYKNFSGSFLEWFRACVNENDLFRFWYKDDPEDAEADYVQISSVIDIGGDFLLGLKYGEEGAEMVEFRRLSEIRTIAILANEENEE